MRKTCFLAHLSRRLIGELIVYGSSRRLCVRPSVRPCVRPFTLSNRNISATSWPIGMKFYLKHHWGGGKASVRFDPDLIRTLVSMATDSSHRVIIVPYQCDPLHSGVLDIPLTVSDHRATFAYIPFTCICTCAYKRKVWFYKRANFENLNEMISSQDWNFINTLAVDEACDNFTSKKSDFCHASIPNKEVTIRPNDKPWFDSQLRTLVSSTR